MTLPSQDRHFFLIKSKEDIHQTNKQINKQTRKAMTTHNIPQFKLIIAGDGGEGVGKATFLQSLWNAHGRHGGPRRETSFGVEVVPLMFHTNLGPIIFNVWDTAGQEVSLSFGFGLGGFLPFEFWNFFVKTKICGKTHLSVHPFYIFAICFVVFVFCRNMVDSVMAIIFKVNVQLLCLI